MTLFPYILRGYRDDYTLISCMISIFQWHNETLNIWTTIGSLCLGSYLYVYFTQKGYSLTVFFLGQLIHNPISILYHIFMPVLPCLRNVDRAAIVAMNVCATWSILYNIALATQWQCHCLHVNIVTMLITLCSSWLLVKSWNIQKTDRVTLLYPIMTSAVGYYISVIIYALLYSKHWITTVAAPAMLVSHSLGALVYINHWPQKWSPGTFDYGFHSHVLMHILIFGCYNFGYIYLVTLQEDVFIREHLF